jgi:penicillin G amidase
MPGLKRTFLLLTVLVGLLLVLPLAYLGVTLARAAANEPEWSASLDLQGIAAPVEILRDHNGIPHIYAGSEHDAYFAQGFVHAQDRLWQLLASRQFLSGRMAEWLGAGALAGDRRNRALLYAASAREDFARLPEEDRELLAAYAAGINAYLGSEIYRRPAEMVVLHVQPEPWAAHDSLLLLRGMYPQLMGFGSELTAQRVKLHAAHPRAMAALEPVPFDHLPVLATAAGDRLSAPPVKEKSFSDSWVVTGDLTVSGRPLLANDPQLPSTLPNFWYLLHLQVDGANRVGATLPGVPGIGAGRNDRIAWGVTAGGVDQADMMLLHGDPDNPLRFHRGDHASWEQFEAREEVFHIRFGVPVRETFFRTRLGTILPADVLITPVSSEPDARVELRAPYLDGDTTMSAFLHLNRASNVDAARDALGLFTGPSLNFLLADVDGAVGYVSAGRYVRRKGDAARVIDFAPVDSSEWTALPFRQNPQAIAGPRQRFVSTNQPPVGPAYPYYLSDLWPAPFRTLRIHELLDATARYDADRFVSMQRDTLSVPARWAVPKLLAMAPEDAGPVEESMLGVLRSWDYRFSADHAGPTVFLTWLRYLHEALARDELGDVLWSRAVDEALPPIVFQVLAGRHTDWCNTPGSRASGECRAVVRQGLTRAAQRLEDTLGPDPQRWLWRDTSQVEHPHQLFSGLPILGKLFSSTSAYPGGPDTLMIKYVGVRDAPRFTQAFFSSSFQAVYDLADLEQSRFMLSTGQSGHFRSTYYDNFLQRFASGERFTLPTDRQDLQLVGRIALLPDAPGPAASP